MAQVVATRAIQSSILCPSSGSVHERFEKLKPSGFAAKVLAREERRSRRVAWRGGPIAAAKRSVRAETEVVPVTPEDAKVCGGTVWFTFFFFFFFLRNWRKRECDFEFGALFFGMVFDT